MQMNPGPGDFEDWRTSSVTQAFFRSLVAERQEIMEMLARGDMMQFEDIAAAYAHWSGKAQGLQEAVEHVPEWAVRPEEEDAA